MKSVNADKSKDCKYKTRSVSSSSSFEAASAQPVKTRLRLKTVLKKNEKSESKSTTHLKTKHHKTTITHHKTTINSSSSSLSSSSSNENINSSNTTSPTTTITTGHTYHTTNSLDHHTKTTTTTATTSGYSLRSSCQFPSHAVLTRKRTSRAASEKAVIKSTTHQSSPQPSTSRLLLDNEAEEEEEEEEEGVVKKKKKKKKSKKKGSLEKGRTSEGLLPMGSNEATASITTTTSNASNSSSNSNRASTTTTTTADEAHTSSTFAPGSLASIIQDPDFNDMGRLHAFLESRGLPSQLFGNLAPRFQQLIQRNSPVYKAQQLLQEMQGRDELKRQDAVSDLCELLVMGNEESLGGFPVKQAVPILTNLLKQPQGASSDMLPSVMLMHHACRALTYMMDVLPRSIPVVAEVVPVFLEKLQSIHCLDVAEQALQALDKISKRHHNIILKADGVSACLTYIDFFSMPAQRTALSITANCLRSLHHTDYPLVKDFVPVITARLSHDDNKCVEKVCSCVSYMIENLQSDKAVLVSVASGTFLVDVIKLITTTPPRISTPTLVSMFRTLSVMASCAPTIAVQLIKMDIAVTLFHLLVKQSSSLLEVLTRTPQEYYEIVSLIGDLMPMLPNDGVFAIDQVLRANNGGRGMLRGVSGAAGSSSGSGGSGGSGAVEWLWKDDFNVWRSYSAVDCALIERALEAGENEVNLCISGNNYSVDFESMRQINEDTGTARRVGRVAPNNNPNNPDIDPTIGDDNKVKDVGDDDKTTKTPIDERLELLKRDPESVSSYVSTIFPALHQVYVSSASPPIKRKCTQALLRMVLHANPQTLSPVLQHCNISSEIAVMLGSSEDVMVVAGMQLSFILIDKMPTLFDVLFYKEGVIHQIDKLSEKAVVVTPPPPPPPQSSSFPSHHPKTQHSTSVESGVRPTSHYHHVIANRYGRHQQQRQQHQLQASNSGLYNTRNYFNSFFPLNMTPQQQPQQQQLLPQQLLQPQQQQFYHPSHLSALSIASTANNHNNYHYSFFPTSIYSSFNHLPNFPPTNAMLDFNTPFGFLSNPPPPIPSHFRKYQAANQITRSQALNHQHHSFPTHLTQMPSRINLKNRRGYSRRGNNNPASTSTDFPATTTAVAATTSRIFTVSDYGQQVVRPTPNIDANNSTRFSSNINNITNYLNNNNTPELLNLLDESTLTNNNIVAYTLSTSLNNNNALYNNTYNNHAAFNTTTTRHRWESNKSNTHSTIPLSHPTISQSLIPHLPPSIHPGLHPAIPPTVPSGNLRWANPSHKMDRTTSGVINTSSVLQQQQQQQLSLLQQQQLQHLQQHSQQHHKLLLQQSLLTLPNKSQVMTNRVNVQEENKERVREWIHQQANKFCKRFSHLSLPATSQATTSVSGHRRHVRRSSRSSSSSSKTRGESRMEEETFKIDALSCLNQLTEASEHFKNETTSHLALTTLHHVLSHQDASTFEILHSHVLPALLLFLTHPNNNNNNKNNNNKNDDVKGSNNNSNNGGGFNRADADAVDNNKNNINISEKNNNNNKDDKVKVMGGVLGSGKVPRGRPKSSDKGKTSKYSKAKNSHLQEEFIINNNNSNNNMMVMGGVDGMNGVKMSRVKMFVEVFLALKEDDTGAKPVTDVFLTLVNKVIGCLHHLEQLTVLVHDLPVGVGGSREGLNALKFFDTHHLKCNLQRHPSCSGARHLKGGSIKIDPLALMQAIEKYLVIRGHARVKMHSTTSNRNNNNNVSTVTTTTTTQQQQAQHNANNNTSIVGSDEDYDDDDDLSDDDDDDVDDDDIQSTFATLQQQQYSRNYSQQQQHNKHSQQQQHLLEFIINNNIIPHNITVYEAIKKFSQQPLHSSIDMSSSLDSSPSSLSHSSMWTATHNIYFRLASDSTTPIATLSGSSSSSYHQKLTKHTKKNKNPPKCKNKTLTKNNEEKTLNDHTNIHHALLTSLTPTLPSLTIHDPSTPLLPLLSTLHAINQHCNTIYHHNNDTTTPIIDHHHFTSSKLTSKATRQLQDPLAVVTSTFPSWLLQIASTCPFLLPFSTRQHLFYSTAFDRERAIARLQREFQHDNHTDHTDHRVLPRLEKKKCSVSRSDILRQAEKIFNELHDPKVLLEVQFEGEVGTGLGPTLEFYALVSREMQRSDWSIWAGDLVEVANESSGDKSRGGGLMGGNSGEKIKVFGGKGEKSEKGGRGKGKSSVPPPTLHYIHHTNGLFPSLLSPHTKTSYLNRVLSRFRLVGKVMAKALMDSRLLDLPLNPALYQWLLAHYVNNNNENNNNEYNNNDGDGSQGGRNRYVRSVGSISSNNSTNNNLYNNNTSNNSNNNIKRAMLSINDLSNIDNTVYNFLKQLLSLIDHKNAINSNHNLSNDQKTLQRNQLMVDGCSLEDLSLNFCVPGYPMVEMRKGGKDEWLSIDNVEDFVTLSLEWLLQIGPTRQLEALKEGFESITSLTSLNIFYPHELDTLFCGTPFETWTPQHLSIYCKVDHGFDLSSAPVQFLFQVMHSFTAQQQRQFLQFTTGSPRLPIGGLKSLSPSLTIVRKSIGPQEDADMFLPSVMTCANYLKLPHYSSLEVTRSKLLTAISEGQKSFHLS